MHGKRLKLIYFSMGGSDVKEFSLGWKKIFFYTGTFIILCFILVFAGLKLFTSVYDNSRVADLKKTNSHLKMMLAQMEKKVKEIEGQVEWIEKDDNDLRVFVDLPQHPKDTWKLGRGGLAEETFSIYSNDLSVEKAKRIGKQLDDLEQRMGAASESRLAIIEKYKENDERWKKTPSIRPVIGGRDTDGWGYRTHPITQKKQFHEGLDISAPRGTPVYAPADGKVISIIQKYKPNQSYGKQLLIDHGNGIQTRYAHLKTIRVKEGEKVSRHQVIALVGDTGRSTGPHLHYEVMENGEKKNPADYILE